MPVLILFLIALLCACLPTRGQQDTTRKAHFSQQKALPAKCTKSLTKIASGLDTQHRCQ